MFLAKKIKRAFNRNEFCGAIIYGVQGVGKSSYALRVAKEVYDSWEKALNMCFFDIREFISFLEENERTPVAIIDDAGVWLSKYLFFRNVHYVDYITGLIHVIRTKLSGLLLTTPDPQALLKSIRALDFYYVKIIRKNETQRYAKIYSQAVLPSGHRYVILKKMELFNVMLPDDIYEKYLQKRQKYIDTILPMLKEYVNMMVGEK